jgi:ubiquinol-cytochrome c reductase cytochrome b subunit
MTPFYAILRAIPNKLAGVIAMGVAIAILFVIPWLDKSPVKSIRYRGIYSKLALSIFVVAFFMLGYLVTVPVSPVKQVLAQLGTFIYFAFFFLMPFYTKFEKCKQVPNRIMGK